MGVNNGLRTCDLLRLKVGQVRGLKPGDSVTIKESKTGKENTLAINKTVHKALRLYLDTAQPADGDWLFPSRKGAGPLQSWQAVDKQESGCRARRGRFRKAQHIPVYMSSFEKAATPPGGLRRRLYTACWAVQKMVKRRAAAFNLKGNFGAHTLRKTFGYIQRTEYGVGFELLCRRYNHSSPAITMRYLGIEDREVHGILMNEIG